MSRCQQIFLVQSFLHDAHLLWREFARECKRLIGRSPQPGLEFFLACQQDGHAFMIDSRDERIRRRRQERVGLDLDGRSVLLQRATVALPNARETRTMDDPHLP